MVLALVPLVWRVTTLLVVPLGAIGVVMMLSSIGFEETIRRQIYKASKWFGWIVVILPMSIAILFAVTSVFGLTPTSVGQWIVEIVKSIFGHPLVLSIVFGSIVSVIAHQVLKRIEWTRASVDGEELVAEKPRWFTRVAFVLLFLIAVISPWVEMPKNKLKVPEPTAKCLKERKRKQKKSRNQEVLQQEQKVERQRKKKSSSREVEKEDLRSRRASFRTSYSF